MRLIAYDCEIKKAIPGEKTAPGEIEEGILHCKGWTDYLGMGVSVVCAYIWGEGYRVFLDDNMDEFCALVADPETILAGFHNHRFDDRLIGAALRAPVDPNRSFDLLVEIAKAVGVNPKGVPSGYGLDAMCEANGLPAKRLPGAMAPILYQTAQIGTLIDYCLGDVIRLKKLIELAVLGSMRGPMNYRILPVDVSMIAGLVGSGA